MVVKVQGQTTKKSFMEAAIELIQKEMDKQGVSPSELARRAGIGRAYLYNVLSGEHTPTLEWLEKVLGVLNISMEMHFEKKS